MTAKTAIECRNLSKSFGQNKAVERVNFDVREGECFGLLGPISSGKSTLLKMIYCGSTISSGELYVFGLAADRQSKDIRKIVGVVPESDSLDSEFSVRDNLLVFSKYFGMQKSLAQSQMRYLLAEFNLLEFSDFNISELSLFQRKSLEFARALLTDPSILVLDEPTLALRDHEMSQMWDFILEQKKQSRTVILGSQSFDEAEKVCDRIALIDKGRILCIGSPQELIEDHVGREVIEFATQDADLSYHLSRLSPGCEYLIVDNKIRLYVKSGQDSREYLKMVSGTDVRIRRATLDDVFASVSQPEILG